MEVMSIKEPDEVRSSNSQLVKTKSNTSKGAKSDGLGIESLKRFAKGGLSGLVSGAVLQPFQVIKTSM